MDTPPGGPMDDKQRYMRQLEGTWDVRKLDFDRRQLHKYREAEAAPADAPERAAREVGSSVGGRNKKREQRSGEESRLRNVLVRVLRAVGRGAWRVRNWLLLIAILGFGAAGVFSAVVGVNQLILLFWGLVALSGILLFIFA